MTLQEQTAAQAIEQLARLGGKLTAEEDIVFQGKKIILPEGTTLRENWQFLRQKEQEDDQETYFERTYKYRPWDGARATYSALKNAFGAVIQRGMPGFFGDNPPTMITIPVSATDTEQIPQDRVIVPHLPGLSLYLGEQLDREFGPLFHLQASGPRKFRHEIEGIFRLIENELKTNSLYRGKAFDGQVQPDFIDLRGVDPDKIVYAGTTRMDLEANLWSLLRYTAKMEAKGIPLKRAVLLEGDYGTGKTETARSTAKIATDHGWSFIMCRPGRDTLKDVMATARLYQPSVVFFEDVDVVADADSKNISQLLDIFDGIQAKDTKIIVVLTTNHKDRIHKGMCRPGRLDSIIHLGKPDVPAVVQMIEIFVKPEDRSPDLDMETVAKAMTAKEYVPVFVIEAIRRAVRYNVVRNRGDETPLETEDFLLSIDGLEDHVDLMNGAKDTVELEPLSTSLGRLMTNVIDGSVLVDSDGDEMYTVVAGSGNNGHRQ